MGRYRIEEKEECNLVGYAQPKTDARQKIYMKPTCMWIDPNKKCSRDSRAKINSVRQRMKMSWM